MKLTLGGNKFSGVKISWRSVTVRNRRPFSHCLLALWMRRLEDSVRPADNGREGTLVPIPFALLDQWVDGLLDEVTFRLTQLLTGHGCFNWFLLCRLRTTVIFYVFLVADSEYTNSFSLGLTDFEIFAIY